MTWKEWKLFYMHQFFGKKYEEWKGRGYRDDRRVFCIMYDKIMEALNSLPEEPNLYVVVAVNNRMVEDFETMKSIKSVFKDR